MPADLSEAQLLAISLARRGAGRLVRWVGGFWTYPDCPVGQSKPYYPYGRETAVPAEYVPASTVYALERRGVLRSAGHDPAGIYVNAYELTETAP